MFWGILSFASGVEPVASSWGLAMIYLVASSRCPCLWGPSFVHFKWPSFGFSLAFGHLGELFVFSSSFVLSLCCHLLVLTQEGEIAKHKVDMCPYGSDLWWVIVNVICDLGWVWELWVVQHVSWLVVRRCGTRRWWSTMRWRSSRDVPCRWTESGEGRMWDLDRRTRRPGDQARWLTSRDIDKCKCTWWSDRVNRVKKAIERVERGSGRLGG
jgi:hypothetical protein